jgi:RNA polymerase-binding transcription factor DksA
VGEEEEEEENVQNVRQTKLVQATRRHQSASGVKCSAVQDRQQAGQLGTKARNQNYIREAVKNRLNSGNVCRHSGQHISLSRLLY